MFQLCVRTDQPDALDQLSLDENDIGNNSSNVIFVEKIRLIHSQNIGGGKVEHQLYDKYII